jgi:hypothetical protein
VTVKNASTSAVLFTVTTDNNGQVSFSTTDVPTVILSSGTFTRRVTSQDAIESAAGYTVSEDAAIASNINSTSSSTRAALDGKYVGKGALVVTVRDYGAKGDGTTDDSTAITNAISAAGVGGTVVFPKGALGNALYVWGSTTGIPALPLSQRWVGSGVAIGQGSGSAYSNCEIYFPNLTSGQKAISATSSCRFDSLHFRGPGVSRTGVIGPTNAGSTNGHVIFRDCQFYDWDTGTQLDASYYSAFYSCEWRHNNTGLSLINVCYNVSLYHPRFDGSGASITGNTTPTYGTCIKADAVQGLKVFGGSIESYGSRQDVTPQAGIVLTNKTTRSHVELYSVYWETACDKGSGWDITGCSSVVFRIVGGDVGLNNHAAWGNYTGVTNCNVKIDSVSVFGTDPSSTASPTLLAGPLSNPANSRVEVDNIGWFSTITGQAFDNGAIGVNSPRVSGQIPDLYTGSGSSNNKWRFMGTGVKVPSTSTIATGTGATASRPTGQTQGCMWFDTTLNKPIWFDGTNWRDATGAVV